MKKNILSLLILLVFSGLTQAQNTLISSQDFEGLPTGIFLNDTSVGNNSGQNKWIINNQYSGGGIAPGTVTQDSTYGGIISFPNGNYLHIHDSILNATTGIANANYAPAAASDRFTIIGKFCTLGFTGVTVAFYYLCPGDSTNAYGEVFYSADGGPWLPANSIQYRNKVKWKYEEIMNPDFDNHADLRIGVRWTNTSGTNPVPVSFGMDDIRIVGDFDETLVGMGIDSVVSSPVCQGTNLLLYYHLDAPLCGQGFYQFELSTINGTFNNPVNLGIYQLNNLNTNGIVSVPIPSASAPGLCYKIRMIRIDVTPAVIGDTTLCIEIQQCANVITTLAPVVLSNPTDTLCYGSVIDIPFFSTGVYTNNTYIAQLSDSNGNWPVNPNVLGTFPNSQTYDPAQGSLPGSVSGLVVEQSQPIPPGCNYFIRIVSNNPIAVGSVYGPFCIRYCDIETNNMQDVSACITNVQGFDTLLNININMFDSSAVYDTSNVFQIQLLSSQTFAVINTGVVGSVQANTDTTVLLSIPILPLLGTVGLQPGMVYMRIIATNSTTPWNTNGTLVRLTIGAPNPTPLSVLAYNPSPFTGYFSNIDSTICIGEAIYWTLSPWNPASSYQWYLNGDPWSTEPFQGILFNGSGNFELYVVETNYGCVGPGSDTALINAIGPPSVAITGPLQICQGDTGSYSVPLQPDTYYSWSSTNSFVVDTLNNEFEVRFPNPGTATIIVQALNECGTATAQRNVIIRSLPNVEIGTDTTVCPGYAFTLQTIEGNGYAYDWYENGVTFSTASSVNYIPDSSTTVYMTVTTYPNLNGGCKSTDSLKITVLDPGPSSSIDTVICEGDAIVLNPVNQGSIYEWSTGETTASITTSLAGTYTVTSFASARCPAVDSVIVVTEVCEDPPADSLFVPNVFTPNGDGSNNYFSVRSANIENFKVIIYDRWGLKVGMFTDPASYWDGTHYKTGEPCSAGTYYYVLDFNFKGKEPEQRSGFITIIR